MRDFGDRKQFVMPPAFPRRLQLEPLGRTGQLNVRFGQLHFAADIGLNTTTGTPGRAYLMCAANFRQGTVKNPRPHAAESSRFLRLASQIIYGDSRSGRMSENHRRAALPGRLKSFGRIRAPIQSGERREFFGIQEQFFRRGGHASWFRPAWFARRGDTQNRVRRPWATYAGSCSHGARGCDAEPDVVFQHLRRPPATIWRKTPRDEGANGSTNSI